MEPSLSQRKAYITSRTAGRLYCTLRADRGSSAMSRRPRFPVSALLAACRLLLLYAPRAQDHESAPSHRHFHIQAAQPQGSRHSDSRVAESLRSTHDRRADANTRLSPGADLGLTHLKGRAPYSPCTPYTQSARRQGTVRGQGGGGGVLAPMWRERRKRRVWASGCGSTCRPRTGQLSTHRPPRSPFARVRRAAVQARAQIRRGRARTRILGD